MLPVAKYPRMVECAPEMTRIEPNFHYRFGIDLFIAGVEAMARRIVPAPDRPRGPAGAR